MSYFSRVLSILSLCCFAVLSSCNEREDVQPEFSVSVKKVTPKQALIIALPQIPDGIGISGCEMGISYTKETDYPFKDAISVMAENEPDEAGVYSFILKHLDPSTDYKFYVFSIVDGKYYKGRTQRFRTQDIPAHAVDLGLSSDVLWADRNVGAETPEGDGGLFAFGETAEKETYLPEDYVFYVNERCRPTSVSKYTIPDGRTFETWYDGDRFVGDGKYILDRVDDVVAQTADGPWRLPDAEDYELLLKETSFDVSRKGSVTGTLFTARNGAEVFFPLSSMNFGREEYSSNLGLYRTAQLRTSGLPTEKTPPLSTSSLVMEISGKFSALSAMPREYGLPARGVYDCSVEERRYAHLEANPVVEISNHPIVLSGCSMTAVDGVALFRGGTDDVTSNRIGVSFYVQGFDDLNVGDEIKPLSISCSFPMSSSSLKRTDSYYGNIYLESRTSERVVLMWDNVRFLIADEMHIVNGSLVCEYNKI